MKISSGIFLQLLDKEIPIDQTTDPSFVSLLKCAQKIRESAQIAIPDHTVFQSELLKKLNSLRNR